MMQGTLQLAWSYILDYENSKNPYKERKIQIAGWKQYAVFQVEETTQLIKTAQFLTKNRLTILDALHLGSAISANCDYFLTTDDHILKFAGVIDLIKITDPTGFIKEVLA
ncbi:hypothetical protein MNBD_NITROSPIRAE01-2048 [hydrothermal vent metagenome]|uniref:PIN domain-containing protein n=1 Tax=hydrothermal vent metagenome TaxID=652676 RepID=A0A3B1D611_9ZZZZ